MGEMARQEKSGAWNSTRERFNVVRMLENLPFDWKLENSVSWCIENQKENILRVLQAFFKFCGEIFIHWYIYDSLWKKNVTGGKWIKEKINVLESLCWDTMLQVGCYLWCFQELSIGMTRWDALGFGQQMQQLFGTHSEERIARW